jgi:hypothetical protein
MTDGPARLRVVGGLDTEPEIAPTPKAKKPRKRHVPMKDQLVRFKCTPCSEAAGIDHTKLVQVMSTPYEANGKLVAGHLWWACARCLQPYFQIRMYGPKK